MLLPTLHRSAHPLNADRESRAESSSPPAPAADVRPPLRARRRRWPGLVLVVLPTLVLVALVAAAFVRIPMLRVQPGPLIDLDERIDVGGVTGDIDGDYDGLTVTFGEVTALDWLGDRLGVGSGQLVDRDTVYPPEVDRDTYVEAQRALFVEATDVAAAVAERELGESVTISGAGARVVAVVPGGPSDGLLEDGDVITAVDGEPVALASDLVGQLPTGSDDPVSLRVTAADGSTRTVAVTPGQVAGLDHPGLGIAITTDALVIDYPIEVTIDQGGVGGPSAGLMTALTVYDLISPTDVAQGRRIAGTGTLSLDGTVGPIGGIEEKARAALSGGADVFVAPAAQADEAAAVLGDRVSVIAVDTFAEALDRLSAATSRSAAAPAGG